jgi:hypothetical protein
MSNKMIFFYTILCFILFTSCMQGDRTMHYTDINKSVRIRGALGRPLGEILNIRGKIIENNLWKPTSAMEELLLEVSIVDGEPLTKPVLLPFTIFPWCGCETPEPLEPFHYIGYETGEMTGIPSGAFDYMPRVAARDFGFTVYFQVCSEEK